ncbi:MAG: restriction endonuclease subunit S [Burkholderiales bacterium]|nr:restriction endonuclease subunit S [Burkholderiales bacterium]
MLLSNLNLLAQAPNGVARLRELILTLAVQGKLVAQDPKDEPASELLKKIRAEKDRLIAEGKIKRDKPLAEIAEAEKPFGLPKGWEWVRCSDYFFELCTGPFGSVIHQEDYVRDGVPLINPSHMLAGRIVHDPRVTLKLKDADRLSAYALCAGDIVLARRGEVGRYALVTEREHGWLCGTGSFFVRLHRSCNREYLGLLFSDSRFRAHLQGESVGTTMTNLNQGILLGALIALPPLAEQSRIVTRVEELMRLCDALEAKGQLEAAQHAQLVSTLLATLSESETPAQLTDNWHRIATHFDLLLDRPEAVDALEQTILQIAVRGLLVPQDPQDEPASELLKKIRAEKDKLILDGKIKRDKTLPLVAEDEQPFALPRGWEWVRLGDVAEANTGFAFKSSDYTNAGTLVFRVTNIRPDGTVDLSDTKFVSALAASTTYKKFLLNADDVLLVMVGGSLGKIGVVEKHCLPAVLNQNMWKMVCNKALDQRYFVDCLRYINAHQIKITNSTHGHLAQGEYLQQPLALPPLAEQSRIVTRVAQLRRLCFELRQCMAASQSTQAHLSEALVQQVS